MVPDAPVVPGPPELPYSLRSRKRSISIFWTLFIIDTLVQPLVLYFTLWYCTNLSHNLGKYMCPYQEIKPGADIYSITPVFTISTAALGGVAVVEYFYRFYNLFKKGSKVRPLNARRSWVCLPALETFFYFANKLDSSISFK